VLEIGPSHGEDIEGACEAAIALLDPARGGGRAWFGKLAKPTEDEEDMLDLAFDLQETSRPRLPDHHDGRAGRAWW
jgi:2Fe-2S ferredoxin